MSSFNTLVVVPLTKTLQDREALRVKVNSLEAAVYPRTWFARCEAPRCGYLIPFIALSSWRGISGLLRFGSYPVLEVVSFFSDPCQAAKGFLTTV